jgi:hypothetical protein
VPIAPENLDTVTVTSPVLRVDAPVQYSLYHFRVNEGASIAAEGYSLLPLWRVAAGGRALQRGHSYQWSCRGWANGAWSPWFVPAWSFSVGSVLQPPSPKLPRNGAVVPTTRPLFVVAPGSGNARYHFQVYDGKTLVGEGIEDLPCWRFEGGGGSLEPGGHYWWTCRIEEAQDTSDWFSPARWFDVAEHQTTTEGEVAGRTELGPSACPNPFFGKTAISLQSAADGRARVSIYDAGGRLVRALAQSAVGNLPSGVVWDGRDGAGRELGPGTYFCRVWVSRDRVETLKLEKLR